MVLTEDQSLDYGDETLPFDGNTTANGDGTLPFDGNTAANTLPFDGNTAANTLPFDGNTAANGDETLPFDGNTAANTLPFDGNTTANGDGTNRVKQSAATSFSKDNSSQAETARPLPSDLTVLSNNQLKERLQSLGEQPGPITHLTRNVYISYLQKILDGTQPAGNQGYKGFKYELALCLNGTIKLPNLQKEEKTAFAEFRVANQSKSFFNYLLLDPQILSSCNVEFKDFVESIFYVGKGKNARSYQHLKDAKHSKITGTMSSKVERILTIWSSGEGVISLHVFNSISPGEAYCREAAIIDAIGRDNLTNAVRGHYHGVMSSWSAPPKRLFGVYLLHKAFQIFQVDTPQPLLPVNL